MQGSLYNIYLKEHSILVYSSLTELREIYTSFTKQSLVSNQKVIILYHYDTPDNIRYYLQDAGIDVTLHEKEHSLLILDSREPLFFTNQNSCTIENLMLEKSKEKGKEGNSIISDMGSFFFMRDIQKNREMLFSFEYSLPKRFQDIVRICLYHKNDINRLDRREKEMLYKSHSQCILANE